MQPRRRFTFKVRRVKDQLTSILQPHHWMWSDICKPQWFFFFFFLRLVAASICDQPWFILFGTALLFLNVVTKHWSSSPRFEGVDIIWQQFFNWFYVWASWITKRSGLTPLICVLVIRRNQLIIGSKGFGCFATRYMFIYHAFVSCALRYKKKMKLFLTRRAHAREQH